MTGTIICGVFAHSKSQICLLARICAQRVAKAHASLAQCKKRTRIDRSAASAGLACLTNWASHSNPNNKWYREEEKECMHECPPGALHFSASVHTVILNPHSAAQNPRTLATVTFMSVQ